jgi:hypothetical protein
VVEKQQQAEMQQHVEEHRQMASNMKIEDVVLSYLRH